MQCIYSHQQLLSFILWQHHLFLLLLLLLLLMILHLTKGQAYFSSFSSLFPSPLSPSHFSPILLLLLLLLLFRKGSFSSFSSSWLLQVIVHLLKGQAYFSPFSSLSPFPLSPSPLSPSHFFPILLLLLLLFERGSFFSFSLFSWLLQVIVHLLKGQACKGCTRCHKRAQTGFNQSKLFAQELKPIHLLLLWVFDKFKEHVCTVEYLFSNRKFEVKIWQ